MGARIEHCARRMSNAVDHVGSQFDTGSHKQGLLILPALARAGREVLKTTPFSAAKLRSKGKPSHRPMPNCLRNVIVRPENSESFTSLLATFGPSDFGAELRLLNKQIAVELGTTEKTIKFHPRQCDPQASCPIPSRTWWSWWSDCERLAALAAACLAS